MYFDISCNIKNQNLPAPTTQRLPHFTNIIHWIIVSFFLFHLVSVRKSESTLHISSRGEFKAKKKKKNSNKDIGWAKEAKGERDITQWSQCHCPRLEISSWCLTASSMFIAFFFSCGISLQTLSRNPGI